MSLKQSLSHFGILLMGATAGYVVGLLTAPVSGDETRRRLSWRLDEGKSKLRRTGQKVVEETATRLERGIESGKQKLEQALSG